MHTNLCWWYNYNTHASHASNQTQNSISRTKYISEIDRWREQCRCQSAINNQNDNLCATTMINAAISTTLRLERKTNNQSVLKNQRATAFFIFYSGQEILWQQKFLFNWIRLKSYTIATYENWSNLPSKTKRRKSSLALLPTLHTSSCGVRANEEKLNNGFSHFFCYSLLRWVFCNWNVFRGHVIILFLFTALRVSDCNRRIRHRLTDNEPICVTSATECFNKIEMLNSKY